MIHTVPRRFDCVFNQGRRITEHLNMKEKDTWEFLTQSMKAMSNISDQTSPSHLTLVMYDVLEQRGYSNLFKDHKAYSIELARAF